MCITKLSSKSCYRVQRPGQELNPNQNQTKQTQPFSSQVKYQTCFKKDLYMLRKGTWKMHPKLVTMDTSEEKGGQGAVKGTIKVYTVFFYIVCIFFLKRYSLITFKIKKRKNDTEGDICSLRNLRGEFIISPLNFPLLYGKLACICVISIFLKIWSIAFTMFPK